MLDSLKGSNMNIISLVAEAKKLLKQKGSKICIDTSGDGTWIYLEKSDWIANVGKGKYFVDYDGNQVNCPHWDNDNMIMYVKPFTHTSNTPTFNDVWEDQ